MVCKHCGLPIRTVGLSKAYIHSNGKQEFFRCYDATGRDQKFGYHGQPQFPSAEPLEVPVTEVVAVSVPEPYGRKFRT